MPKKTPQERKKSKKLSESDNSAGFPSDLEKKEQPNPSKEDLEKFAERIEASADGSENGEMLKTLIQSEIHSGPLPSPNALKEYEEILPGSADRIIKIAERQQDIYAKGENKYLNTDRIRVLGSILISILIVALAGYALYLNTPFIAVLLAAIPILLQAMKSLLKDGLIGKKNSED